MKKKDKLISHLTREVIALKPFKLLSFVLQNKNASGTQGCSPIVDDVGWEPWSLRFNFQQRQNTNDFFPFILAMVNGRQSYLTLVTEGGDMYCVLLVEVRAGQNTWL